MPVPLPEERMASIRPRLSMATMPFGGSSMIEMTRNGFGWTMSKLGVHCRPQTVLPEVLVVV
jgi:hypothetical protein